MKQILKDFYKYHLTPTLGYLLSVACVIGGMLLAGVYTNDDLAWLGIAVTVFFAAMLIYQCVSVYIIAPLHFRKQVASLSEEHAEELFSEYPDAKKAENHHYMSDMVLFYCNRRMIIVRYKDISAITTKRKDLLLYLNDSAKVTLMPCPVDGLCAVAFAYMRDKNPDIKRLGSAD
ncbi:MAG: hypothetical protein J6A16_08275 [Oscillospiraceae bacterium]|nr:hypothetical protein [Oscillospiraceae bacterium]